MEEDIAAELLRKVWKAVEQSVSWVTSGVVEERSAILRAIYNL